MKPFSSMDLLGMHRTLRDNVPINGIDDELNLKIYIFINKLFISVVVVVAN